MKFLIVLCLAVSAYGLVDPEVKLPEGMIFCDRDDPQRDTCIMNSIQTFISTIHQGVPQLKFPAFDPFISDNIKTEYKSDDIYGSVFIKQPKMYGISRAQVKEVHSEVTEDEMDLEVKILFPRIFMDGNYKGEGRFNGIHINSKGYYNVTMRDIDITWKMAGALEENNGEKYMRIKSFSMSPIIGDLKVYASGLMPDPALNRISLELINQYWPLAYQAFLPEAQKIWDPIMIDLVNKFFLNVPFRRLMPKKSEF